jgi:ESS family glutamate:Na+ symporter
MTFALITAAVLLATGLALRAWVRPFRAAHIPAAVVGGVVGFGIVQALTHLRNDAIVDATKSITSELSSWPTPLIAVVFAGLLLGHSESGSFTEAVKRGARSGALAWIIILGQIAIGLLVYATLIHPTHTGVPASFGQLLEVSWAGGHGASGAMGSVYERQGFPAGRDLAFFLATVGLVYGVVGGLVIVNLAIRKGWTAKTDELDDTPTEVANVVTTTTSVGAPTAVSGIDSLALQAVLVAIAFGAGAALQAAFSWVATNVLGPDNPDVKGEWVDSVQSLPLFLFALIGGWAVRLAMTALHLDSLIDATAIARIQGVAMEFLIVAAITVMRVNSLGTYFVPALVLVVLAIVWSIVSLLFIAPRLLPRAYWFELGLLNFGFSTANTPQGFMLLRVVDPKLKTRAAEDYAVAAPLSAPFIGGGIVTFVLPVVLDKVGPWPVVGAALVMGVALYVVARRLIRQAPGQARGFPVG